MRLSRAKNIFTPANINSIVIISIELKNGARHRKEHPKVSKSAETESYRSKRKGMVHF